MKLTFNKINFSCSIITLASLIYSPKVFSQKKNVIEKNIILNASSHFQTIDGFGANVNPAEWLTYVRRRREGASVGETNDGHMRV
jgi:O-glycosyl hydrolase